MKLELRLNEFFSSYKLFTTSANLLNLVNEDEVISNIVSKYPKLAKILDVDNIDESVISLIYMSRGNYDSIGMVARLLGTNVKIFNKTDPVNPIYDSLNGINSIPQAISKIQFDKLEYNVSMQLKTGFIDLLKELVWFIDPDSLITCQFVEIGLEGETTQVNEANINFTEFIELN